ncbi:MAG: ferrous iron transporter B [Acidobacteriota bacterium]
MEAHPKAATVLDPTSELNVLDNAVRQEPLRIVLVGQPNVGKSVVFSRLTSRYVTISNYPGTTVEVFSGRTRISGQEIEVLDTPGINGIQADSEDERVTLATLERDRPDLVIQVADAKNLRRALLLTAQLSRFRIPMVLVLNMMDECRIRGIQVDSRALSRELGIPVIETVATSGAGMGALRESLGAASLCSLAEASPMHWVEQVLGAVRWSEPATRGLGFSRTRILTLAALAGVALHLGNYLGPWLGLPTLAGAIQHLLGQSLGLGDLAVTTATVILAYLAPVLVPVLWAIKTDLGFNERFGVWARHFLPGSLILVVTASLTYQLVGNLGAQVFVAILENGLFATYVTPFLQTFIPHGFFYDLLVGQYGLISMGLSYGLAIVLPVVGTFFIAFSFLEDSGYLPRLSILSDRLLRVMGLNGKAFLPMVLGLGCVTMATMTTRILHSKKERFLATFLLALGVPCSAQLGVILGITSGLPFSALAIVFGTVFLQLIIVGSLLAKLYPGERSAFILELPPIRFPVWKNIFRKTYVRVYWFLKEAVPLFVLGALVLFVLDKVHLLSRIIHAMQPIVTGLLGLPQAAASVFLMGFLRRDYGAAGLFEMSRQGLLDTTQIVVGLVVLTLFVPCVANFFVMIKEQGLRNAVLMVVSILVYAVAVGTGLSWILHHLMAPF